MIFCGFGSVRKLSAQTGPWTASGSSIYYNGGSVGIGTATPLSLFQARVGTNQNLAFQVTGATGTAGLAAYNDAGTAPVPLALSASSFSFLYGYVGIGTTNPQHLLHVAGTIGAEEVLVTSTGADYVFQPGYRLQPLSEVAKYIEANHHLPDIPSADEVKQKGIGVGAMEAKLLAKVEELTLHMIRQEQENQELRGRIAQLEKTTAAPGAIPLIAK